jgi:Icc-related predicted phosphoesterase
MRVVCASDTHSQNLLTKWEWPKGDIFIHAGDISAKGREPNLQKSGREILSLGYRYNIFIPGNHDRLFYEEPSRAWRSMPGIIVLQDQTVEIEGLRIYGSSWIRFVDGIYPFEIQGIEDKWKLIPADTDILVTHMPPLNGVLDVNDKGEWRGDHTLMTVVRDMVKPKLHVFGHIHAGHGTMQQEDTTYVNAALTGQDRKPAYQPIVVEL